MTWPWLQCVHIHHLKYAFPHWKCMLCCCVNCPCIDIPGQESGRHHSNTSPSIRFHIYHLIARFMVHGRRQLDEKKVCHFCLQDTASV